MKDILQPIDLVGESLSEVDFTQDYIELNFAYTFLRFFSNPSIQTDSFSGKFPDAGSRDALCSLIGKELTSLQLDDKKELVLVFESKDTVTLPLNRNICTLRRKAFCFSGREGGIEQHKINKKERAKIEKEKQIRLQLTEAWEKRDYWEFVKIASSMNPSCLNETELIKVDYARKRLEKNNPHGGKL